MGDVRTQRRAEVLRDLRVQQEQRARRSRSVARRLALLRAASESPLHPLALHDTWTAARR